ncbi:tektin-1 [Anabrus simplex]|uniref:tektin-1 n=1 Tax=Anabrus simplex TaxID=316456 RepID=UPI0035A31F07
MPPGALPYQGSRQSRLAIDLTRDKVDEELQKEKEIIEGVLSILRRALQQTKEKIRVLRSSKYFIDCDREGKDNALAIDDQCATFWCTDNQPILQINSSLDSGDLTLDEWANFSVKNIERAVKEVKDGRSLRSYVDMLMKQTTEDLWKQYNTTNEAFYKRIEETKTAKSKLEIQHYETLQRANEMVLSIGKLEKAIKEKEEYLALAQIRLSSRKQRPKIELTKDDVERSLLIEVQDLQESISKLQEMLYESQSSLRSLLKVQMQLEEDINIKTNTLKIDEVDCMTLRQSMDFHEY